MNVWKYYIKYFLSTMNRFTLWLIVWVCCTMEFVELHWKVSVSDICIINNFSVILLVKRFGWWLQVFRSFVHGCLILRLKVTIYACIVYQICDIDDNWLGKDHFRRAPVRQWFLLILWLKERGVTCLKSVSYDTLSPWK